MNPKGRKRYHRGRREKREGRKKRNLLSNLILVLAIAVFCYSGYQLFQIYRGYKAGEDEYAEIYDEVVSITNEKNEERFTVDFKKLKKMNSEVVGWIRFEEPAIINYPIVQGKNNSKYLYKTFQGYKNTVGSIFVNCYNNADFEDRNTIVYGHRMYNGTMFDKFGKYEKKSFWEKYPHFYIYKDDGTEMKYHIYSVAIVSETSGIYNWEFEDDDAFLDFIALTKKDRLYDTDEEVGAEDKVVTLSTCTNQKETERLVIMGVREQMVNADGEVVTAETEAEDEELTDGQE